MDEKTKNNFDYLLSEAVTWAGEAAREKDADNRALYTGYAIENLSEAMQVIAAEMTGAGAAAAVGVAAPDSIIFQCSYSDSDTVECIMTSKSALTLFSRGNDMASTVYFTLDKAQQMADWWTNAAAYLRQNGGGQ